MQHPAKKIKFLLRTGSTTVQDFADRMGITLESMRDILDEREWPTPGLIARMCTFFGVGETYFGVPPLASEIPSGRTGSRPGKSSSRTAEPNATTRAPPSHS